MSDDLGHWSEWATVRDLGRALYALDARRRLRERGKAEHHKATAESQRLQRVRQRSIKRRQEAREAIGEFAQGD